LIQFFGAGCEAPIDLRWQFDRDRVHGMKVIRR
jgi:hypothetical protein